MTSDDDVDFFVLRLPMERLDAAAAPELKAQIAAEMGEHMKRVIVDFANVVFVDSTGLGVIVSLLKMMPSDGRMAVSGVAPAVRRLFEITGLDKIFLICGSVEEARVAIGG